MSTGQFPLWAYDSLRKRGKAAASAQVPLACNMPLHVQVNVPTCCIRNLPSTAMRVHADSVGDGDMNMQLAEAICTARSHVLCEKLSCRCQHTGNCSWQGHCCRSPSAAPPLAHSGLVPVLGPSGSRSSASCTSAPLKVQAQAISYRTSRQRCAGNMVTQHFRRRPQACFCGEIAQQGHA